MGPNKMKKTLLLFGLLLLGCFKIDAQSNLTLYQSKLVPQSTTINPGFIPKTNVNIGLPVISGISFSFANAFSFNDVKEGIVDFPDRLQPVNYLTFESSIDLLHIGFRVKQSYLSLSIQEKISAVYSYPSDLFRLVIDGNGGEFLGQTISLDGFGINFNHYREYAVSYARPITRKLTIGARAKYLYGMENVYTEQSELGITTIDDPEQNYPIVIDGKAVIHTSGINAVFDNRISEYMDTLSSVDGLINYNTGKNNHGYGVDIGFNYELNKRLSFSAAINDFGSITWNDQNRSLKNENINFRFEGIDFNEFISGGGSDTAVQRLLDSLNAAFALEESQEAYTTPLTPKVYGGVRFNFTKNQAIGATTFFQFVPG